MRRMAFVVLSLVMLLALTACGKDCQHTYTEEVIKAVSYTADGQTRKTCSKCGDVQTVTVPMLETPVEYQVTALSTYEGDGKHWVIFDLEMTNISERSVTVVMGDMIISDGTTTVTIPVIFPHPMDPGTTMPMPDFGFAVDNSKMSTVDFLLKDPGFEGLTFTLQLTEVHYQNG